MNGRMWGDEPIRRLRAEKIAGQISAKKTALRHSPNRLILGEIRRGEEDRVNLRNTAHDQTVIPHISQSD
jgi:type IV secretory pathway ATPase VirB11/archaellum biosynthesis ATPase